MLQDILSGKILASQFIVSIGAENDFSDYFTLNLLLVRTKRNIPEKLACEKENFTIYAKTLLNHSEFYLHCSI